MTVTGLMGLVHQISIYSIYILGIVESRLNFQKHCILTFKYTAVDLKPNLIWNSKHLFQV